MGIDISQIDLSNLSRSQKVDLLELLNEYDTRLKYNKLHQWFPESGPRKRSDYPKSLQFFDKGKTFKTRVIFGGNRSGKSTTSHYEAAVHATGLYPEWWTGAVFDDPQEIWLCGDSHANVRDISQYQLCGNVYDIGSGMIPKHLIKDQRNKQGIPNALDHIIVQHKNGGLVKVAFKSYEQGRKSFQGTAIDFIVLDEEPKEKAIFSECLARTMTTGGKIVFSFTPLNGLTPLVLDFLPLGKFPEDGIVPGQPTYVLSISWDDVPHLPEEEKKAMIASWMPHEIETRTKGLPMIGSGKIFTVLEQDFVIPPFEIPVHWPRFYGLDIPMFSGRTACVFMTYDQETDTIYLYDEFKCTGQHLEIACSGIKRRGAWIPGVIDPSSKRKAADGDEYLWKYQNQGLDLRLANNAVGPGLLEFHHRLGTGGLKVFETCQGWLQEYRIYRYDKNQEVAKNQEDDYMDATRYALMSGLSRACIKPDELDSDRQRALHLLRSSAKCDVTGY